MKLFHLFFLGVLLGSSGLQAQFLPNNTDLNKESVERWMKSSQSMVSIVETIDQMFRTEAELVEFDLLLANDQDQKIKNFLESKQAWDNALRVSKQFGWKSPGEYRRLGTKLGNAIAAYFVKKDQQGLTADQIKQMNEKLDTIILSVPERDIQFVMQNEKQLQRFIQRYKGN